MDLFLEGLGRAIRLLGSLDPEVLGITAFTLKVCLLATLASLVLGLGLALVLALTEFPGRRLVISLVNTGMGLPPVVVGLFVTLLLWRSGPLGGLDLLYTPTAIVLAQTIIATPLIAGVSLSALQQLPPELRLQILALGASRTQMVGLLLREARLPLLAALMAGFGGVVSEVGASLMVGGNLKGRTRVLTTATVMETGRGDFATAIALGLILLGLTFAVNAALTRIQQRTRPR